MSGPTGKRGPICGCPECKNVIGIKWDADADTSHCTICGWTDVANFKSLGRHIHLYSGVPASGKTTRAKAFPKLHEHILHRDEWRAELRKAMRTTEYFPTTHDREFKLWTDFINFHLDTPHDVTIDQTTTSVGALRKLLKAINIKSGDVLHLHLLLTPLNVCINRNSHRKGFAYVPEDVMESMDKSFRKFASDVTVELILDILADLGKPPISVFLHLTE